MLVASVGVVSLGVSNAYADEVADGTRTDVTNCVSPTTGWKDDNSSFWVNVTQWSGLAYCNFYADAYVGGWIDCTTPGYGTCRGPKQYELYNRVWEDYGHRECRLGGYRSGGTGFVSGEWTPDCEGTFPIMR